MKNKYLVIPAVALATLFTGCVGVGPNTQQGAVAGGALGALAGAVLGNNSRGGSALGGAILGGELGALAGGTIGNSIDHQQGTLYGHEAAYAASRPVAYAPPPPPASPPAEANATPPPPPTATAVWVSGYWAFDGRNYNWLDGHWEVPPPGAHAFVAAHWESQYGQYRFIPGYWQ
ncbi:MAG: hypothetical protein ACHQ4G_03755 [Opitutales bacterium]